MGVDYLGHRPDKQHTDIKEAQVSSLRVKEMIERSIAKYTEAKNLDLQNSVVQVEDKFFSIDK